MGFVNFSNHPSAQWSEKQTEAARKWGEIADVAFPPVPAKADEQTIETMAQTAVEQILALRPDAVMCQGEFTLTYQVVSRLKAAGITVVSACSMRNVRETHLEDGMVQKTAVFDFVQFREYENPGFEKTDVMSGKVRLWEKPKEI